jgi:hypothetical protein
VLIFSVPAPAGLYVCSLGFELRGRATDDPNRSEHFHGAQQGDRLIRAGSVAWNELFVRTGDTFAIAQKITLIKIHGQNYLSIWIFSGQQ